MEMEGYKFTWERGKGTENWVEIKLDRALVTPSWLDKFPNAKLTNLEVSTSDHCLILLTPVVQTQQATTRSFKFENAWLREPMCRKLVEDIWLLHHDSPLAVKIEKCSEVLAEWGKEITGSFKTRISKCEKRIKLLKGRRDADSAKRYQEENERLAKMLTQKEIFWRQRSKQLWLKEGDHNSKYFHAAAKTRKRNNQINNLRDDSGSIVWWDNGL
ncbi:uncharacterized protein LOC133036837 [Cannabis sativa]|uniref:uncharacterized protein LOC133036837 n=1 Tax=Cannabis sativa TaxID=3483 RepID=UPI0029CA049F|nr:uncharacterized protein LOC133036837 [Cannabis sativa]